MYTTSGVLKHNVYWRHTATHCGHVVTDGSYILQCKVEQVHRTALEQTIWWRTNQWKNKSVFNYYVRWKRGSTRIRPPLLQQSIDISCQQWVCCSGFMLRQTDWADTISFCRPCSAYSEDSAKNPMIDCLYRPTHRWSAPQYQHHILHRYDTLEHNNMSLCTPGFNLKRSMMHNITT